MSRPERGRYLVGANLQLPKPNDETHVMTGQFRGSRTVTDIEYMAKYHTIKSAKNYGSSGVVSMVYLRVIESINIWFVVIL